MPTMGAMKDAPSHIYIVDDSAAIRSRLEEPGIQRQLRNALSRELVRNRAIMLLLRSMTGEERIATFLLDLLQRLAMRLGRPPDELHLRMTRAEIGSHLGLSLETVSRLFSRFQEDRLICVTHKHIRILDHHGLRMTAFPP